MLYRVGCGTKLTEAVVEVPLLGEARRSRRGIQGRLTSGGKGRPGGRESPEQYLVLCKYFVDREEVGLLLGFPAPRRLQ
mgnify:CR=1 FL=1